MMLLPWQLLMLALPWALVPTLPWRLQTMSSCAGVLMMPTCALHIRILCVRTGHVLCGREPGLLRDDTAAQYRGNLLLPPLGFFMLNCAACSDLEGVLLALDLSRVTFNRIRLNFFWAMAYNVVMLPVAAGVLYPCIHMQIPPWVAGKFHPTWLTALHSLQWPGPWLHT